jgi:hypothetical protein
MACHETIERIVVNDARTSQSIIFSDRERPLNFGSERIDAA